MSSPIWYKMGLEAVIRAWLEREIKRKRGLETKFEDDGCSKPVSDELLIQSLIDKMFVSV